MTTLDDAAERRCQELLRAIVGAVELLPVSGSNILAALQIAWADATEAAAKKCEAEIVALRARADTAEADRAKIRESFTTSSTDEENRLRAEVLALRTALRDAINSLEYVNDLSGNGYPTPIIGWGVRAERIAAGKKLLQIEKYKGG